MAVSTTRDASAEIAEQLIGTCIENIGKIPIQFFACAGQEFHFTHPPPSFHRPFHTRTAFVALDDLQRPAVPASLVAAVISEGAATNATSCVAADCLTLQLRLRILASHVTHSHPHHATLSLRHNLQLCMGARPNSD